jgi:hypothetical protein
MSENAKLEITKEGSYGLVEQFRNLGKRVALPDLNLYKNRIDEKYSYEFTIRNPWYTTIPVSTVISIDLIINDYLADEKEVLFVIRDQAIPMAYAKNLHELMWGMGECAKIRIMDQNLPKILKNKNDIRIQFVIRTAFEGYHLPNNQITYLFNVEMGVI